MKGGNSAGEKGHPVRHGAGHRRRASAGSASVKISYSVTPDIPDGRPWPPPDRDILWAAVRRANGYTLWRAIELAQVRSGAVGIFPTQGADAASLGDER